jgi:predicted MFS family arabinose efflux permease
LAAEVCASRVHPALAILTLALGGFGIGTTEFVTEEAVKPIVTVAGQLAMARAMARAVTGQDRKKR